MKTPSNELACQALILQAEGEGRGEVLFGENRKEILDRVLPFVAGVPFPALYLEFPLAGTPFLDVTVLYSKITPGTRFLSEAAAGTERIIDWFAEVRPQHKGLCFGYELDSGSSASAPAAVHFQLRGHLQLMDGLSEALGEPDTGKLYLNLAGHMPEGWPLAFFGMFRGRPGAPLRACGYLNREEQQRCGQDPNRLSEAFRQVGFRAYDDRMLDQAAAFLAVAPESADFQFDIYPDGSIGDTFAIDVNLGLKQSEEQKASFTGGACAEIMRLLETWGVADARWHTAAGICFTRAIPVENENGKTETYALTLLPKWVKARWRGTNLQNAKLYCEAIAGIIGEGDL